MFNVGWTELLVIGLVALIVVGPKDLPGMFRTLGKFTAKARSMAREFTRAMEDAADEAGVKDVASTLKSATSVKNLGLDKVKDVATDFENWGLDDDKPAKPDVGPETKALSQERAEAASKIRAATEAAAKKRLAAEEAAGAGTAGKTDTAAAGAKTAGKKAAAKKPAARKPAASKPAAKKPAAKKPAAKKPAPRKAAASSKKKAGE